MLALSRFFLHCLLVFFTTTALPICTLTLFQICATPQISWLRSTLYIVFVKLLYKYIVMKRMVVTFDGKHKPFVRAYLVSNRVQYSMSTDIYTGDVHVYVPNAKGVALLAELRRFSIPYRLV